MSEATTSPACVLVPFPNGRSEHQQRVDRFMAHAGQDLPSQPCRPPAAVRIRCAKLITEEYLETMAALGVSVIHDIGMTSRKLSRETALAFIDNGQFDIAETIDGCCDLRVVTTSTLSACGVPDEEPQRLVDEANLAKFGPGGYRREDGKWIKPPDHKSPDFNAWLRELARRAAYEVAGPAGEAMVARG